MPIADPVHERRFHGCRFQLFFPAKMPISSLPTNPTMAPSILPTNAGDNTKPKLTSGQLAGIIIGSVVGSAFLGAITYYYIVPALTDPTSPGMDKINV